MSVFKEARAQEIGLCNTDTDIILILDRSASMEDGASESFCVWYSLEWVGPSKQWVEYQDFNVSEEWCNEKTTSLYPSQYFSAINNKITVAKQAADNFVDLLGSNDQSGLVYFSYYEENNWLAKLEKELSYDHNLTKTLINGLDTEGPSNIGDAIGLSIQELISPRANSQASKVIILLTDGKPNKPFGSGSGENSQDVQYVLDKSLEAAQKNIRLFTIGLGEDEELNQDMLIEAANNTQANYYYSPTQENLEDIYKQISSRICEYGSVSGYKFKDINKNGQKEDKEPFLENWNIILSSNNTIIATQTTDSLGFYRFSGLPAGNYLLSEQIKNGWEQTFPEDNSYEINLAWEENIFDKNFGNYKSPTGSSITVCKYEDSDGLASTSGDQIIPSVYNWSFELSSLGTTSSTTVLNTNENNNCVVFDNIKEGEYLIKENKIDTWFPLYPKNGVTSTEISLNKNLEVNFINARYGTVLGHEYIDSDGNSSTTNDRYLSTSTVWTVNLNNISTSTNNGSFKFKNVLPGEYLLKEVLMDNWISLSPKDGEKTILVKAGEEVEVDFINYKKEDEGGGEGDNKENHSVCGNGILEKNEECDDNNLINNDGCSSICKIESSGASGGSPAWLYQATGNVIPKEDPEIKNKETKIDIINEEKKEIPILNIIKTTKDKFINPGGTTSYEIKLYNSGNSAIKNIVLKDVLANGFHLKDREDSDELFWELGDLDIGEEKIINYSVYTDEDINPGIYINFVEATADNHPLVKSESSIEIRKIEVKGIQLILADTGFNINEFLLILALLLIMIILRTFIYLRLNK